MENENEFVGRRCRLIKKDGHVKVGVVRQINVSFVQLEYYDGRLEVVPFSEIQSVVEDKVLQ